MIKQHEQVDEVTTVQQEPVGVVLPQINDEVDVPFNGQGYNNRPNQANLSKTDSLDEEITKFKYLTGKQVLFVSMAAMGISVIVSIFLSVFKIENALVSNSFEVFKLIAMTVLGYIFGSKTK